ncbi:MAG: hypothetical protein ACREP4_10625 [Stenotrophomonas sp.]|uniref:hypothetical protein n=1 Tax=Stenotrophomonas sp. TaxID=69392 RepID=UPI003D6C91BD
MRLRHLPQFRQTRRGPALSGNADYRSYANKLNPLNFEALFSGPDVALAHTVTGAKWDRLRRWMQAFVPPVGEKFP